MDPAQVYVYTTPAVLHIREHQVHINTRYWGKLDAQTNLQEVRADRLGGSTN